MKLDSQQDPEIVSAEITSQTNQKLRFCCCYRHRTMKVIGWITLIFFLTKFVIVMTLC